MKSLIPQIGLPLIAVVVPLIVAGIRKVMPRIPKLMLPALAAILGALLDVGMAYLANLPMTGAMGVMAGLAGVGLRELKDQSMKALANKADAALKFAVPLMVAGCLVATLGACAGSVATRTTVALSIACDSYATVLDQLTPLKASGKLSAEAITRVDGANNIVAPICAPGSVIDPATAVGTVEHAITLLKLVREGN